MKKRKNGRKKLSRQFAVMVFVVQMITALILGTLVRMEGINIYLSAKNDMISELLRKEARALDLDRSNPSPAWCFDYWKAHYSEFGSDVEMYEESLSEEEQDYFYDLSYELSEDEAEARASNTVCRRAYRAKTSEKRTACAVILSITTVRTV